MAESRGLWFLVGLSLGALAGVLYAPQSGEKTREMLRSKADEGRDLVQRKTGEVRQQMNQRVTTMRDQANDIADRGRQVVSRQIDQFQAAVEAGKQAYREAAGAEPKGDAASQL
jgi:gas vesicle protein